MQASEFTPPPPREYGAVARALATGALYGIGWPVSKVLSAFGKWPPFSPVADEAALIQAYRPTAADVFICSYFKSGTTWLMQVVTQIAFRGRAEFANIHHAVPWPDGPRILQAQLIPLDDASPARLSPTGLRAIKTHLPAGLIPRSTEARYIAMVRDPKAVAVSGYHFIKAMSLGPTMPSFRRWLDLFLARSFFQGAWAEHLAGFWARRDEPNVLFMTYEELRGDRGGAIDRIAAFMGVALTAKERAAVIERSGFAAMKREEARFDPPRIVPWTRAGAMLRKGGEGVPDALLTPDLAARVDDWCRAELLRLDCDFDYDGAYGGQA